VRKKLGLVRVKINKSERKLIKFKIKMGNPLIAQSFEKFVRNLRNKRHKK